MTKNYAKHLRTTKNVFLAWITEKLGLTYDSNSLKRISKDYTKYLCWMFNSTKLANSQVEIDLTQKVKLSITELNLRNHNNKKKICIT